MSYNLPRIINNLYYEIDNRTELTFLNSNNPHELPSINTIKIYSKENNDLILLNDEGEEKVIGTGTGPAENTQNITATPGDTKIGGILEVIGGTINTEALFNEVSTTDIVATNSSYVMVIQTAKIININKIGIHTVSWPVASPASIVCNVYSQITQQLLQTYNITKNIIFENHYVINIPVLTLPIGVYQFSFGLTPDNLKSLTLPTYDPSIILNMFGGYSPVGGGAFTNQLNNIPNGNIWFSYSTTPLLKCDNIETLKINNLTPFGGVFMLTSSSNQLFAGVNNLFSGASFVGGLTVPANTFKISSYKLIASGRITSQNNGDINFTLKSGSVVLGIITTTLVGVSGETYFLGADFGIQAIGVAGVSRVVTTFNFSYANGNANFQGDSNLIIEDASFDTTIDNTLTVNVDIEAGTTTNIITHQAYLKQKF